MTRDFLKMHGLGNDFVVIDARERPFQLSAARVRAIADRRLGVGCDQVIVLEEPVGGGESAALMRILNADGGEVGACGNAARCVGWLLLEEAGANRIHFETIAGPLIATRAGDHRVSVDMGPARLAWNEIPLAEELDTAHLPITVEGASAPVAVSMGNPHCVFFVDDAEAVALEQLGPGLETHPLFPERANIEFASVIAPNRLRMRVWERGAGVTMACGTGACATLVAACRLGLIDGRSGEVVLDGGTLAITWGLDGTVVMTGPVVLSFSGTLSSAMDSA